MYGLLFGDRLFALLAPAQRQLVIRTVSPDTGPAHARLPLPSGFDPGADHLLRVEVNAGRAVIALDGNARRWMTRLPAGGQIDTVALVTERAAAVFSGFAITLGWQDLFTEQGIRPADLGWHTEDTGAWRVEDALLRHTGERGPSAIAKGAPLDAYEFIINARLEPGAGADATYGFYPAYAADQPGPLVAIERSGEGWALALHEEHAPRAFPLPGFDPHTFQQFRFRKQGGRLAFHWEARALGEILAPDRATQVGLYARRAAFDMARVTELRS
jgi:hypothetical protein